MSKRYQKALHTNSNKSTYTENQALSNKSTMSPLLDFFATCGSLRQRDEAEILDLFYKAFAANPKYSIKTLFYCRDIREGLGERRTFSIILHKLAQTHPELVRKNIRFIPEYGRWDDLFSLKDTPVEDDMVALIRHQIAEDLNAENPSLLGKWLPNENTSSRKTKELARWLIVKLETTPRKYRVEIRRPLIQKLDVVEVKMCQKKWDQIDYEKVPSKAMLNYRNAFKFHDLSGFEKYLSQVESGEKKIHAGVLYPYELLQRVRFGIYDIPDRTIISQWKALPNYVPEEESSIVVADTSGSMTWTGPPYPIDVAISLAIYFAERNKVSCWKDCFLTFSTTPTFQKIKGANIYDRYRSIDQDLWEGNTDLQAVFDLLLNTAIANKIPEEEMLKKVYIISDMEFDQGTSNNDTTNFELIKQQYQAAGYEVPQLVFWNVQSRNNQFPVTLHDSGTALVSGCSPTVFKAAMNLTDPLDLVYNVLDSPRYTVIQV